MSKYDFLESFLHKCDDSKRRRHLTALQKISPSRINIEGRDYINFSSNDYLALSHSESIKKAAKDAISIYGNGSTASRLVCGNHQLHMQLEQSLANWKGKEAALLFNSGFQANSGIIPAIADRKTLIFSDRLNHASIVDGIRLSGARHLRFRHADMEDLEKLLKKHAEDTCRKIVISETLFSMDGDYTDLQSLVQLTEKYDALLYLDDAHGSGVCGPNGRGPAHEIINKVDFYIGTFGKALGSFGAYCACSKNIKDYLVNCARSFIFSTALPPAVIAANLAAVNKVKEMDIERKRIAELSASLRQRLKASGFETNDSNSPIVPLFSHTEEATLALSNSLKANGIFAIAIRPPTVPAGTCRLRLTITADHSEDDINKLMQALQNVSI